MRVWIALAALGGFLAVSFGAFAAHGLEAWLSESQLGWIETGARYQMYHALAALGAAALVPYLPGRRRSLAAAAGLFFAGMVLFSGALYVMAMADLPSLGMVVPLGGLAYMAGWIALAWSAVGGCRGGGG